MVRNLSINISIETRWKIGNIVAIWRPRVIFALLVFLIWFFLGLAVIAAKVSGVSAVDFIRLCAGVVWVEALVVCVLHAVVAFGEMFENGDLSDSNIIEINLIAAGVMIGIMIVMAFPLTYL